MVPVLLNSGMGGAPSLTGQVGSLITVLDYCLVTGCGWSKAFSGTNAAVYRPPAGPRHYLYVDDTGGATVFYRGYVAASGLGAGTEPFPTVAQSATGLSHLKSSSADAVARPWVFYGDDRTGYFLSSSGGTVYPPTGGWIRDLSFGEFLSSKTADNYKSIVTQTMLANVLSGLSSALVQGFAPRDSVSFSAGAAWMVGLGNGQLGAIPLPFPNPADAGLHLSKIGLIERGTAAAQGSVASLRGELRGVHQINHSLAAIADGSTWDGVGRHAGRSFAAARMSTLPSIAFETTAWDVSS